MILANGCNITKSEKFKGVWILSVPTVYIYIYAGLKKMSRQQWIHWIQTCIDAFQSQYTVWKHSLVCRQARVWKKCWRIEQLASLMCFCNPFFPIYIYFLSFCFLSVCFITTHPWMQTFCSKVISWHFKSYFDVFGVVHECLKIH